MKCPKCGDQHLKYKEERKQFQSKHKGFNAPKPRENFEAECVKCEWTGEIR